MTQENEQIKKIGLFDFLNDVSYKKEYLYNEDTKSQYNAFMILRGLGQHIDTVLLANELNKRPNISKEMHHDFLFYVIDARKRYGKWSKEVKQYDEDVVEYIKDKYQYNTKNAIEQYLSLMSNAELKQLKKKVHNKGGKQ